MRLGDPATHRCLPEPNWQLLSPKFASARKDRPNEAQPAHIFGLFTTFAILLTEAARASIDFGFAKVNLDRIIGLVVPENEASRRVLEHLGMAYVRHVHYWGLDLRLYEVGREGFRAKVGAA